MLKIGILGEFGETTVLLAKLCRIKNINAKFLNLKGITKCNCFLKKLNLEIIILNELILNKLDFFVPKSCIVLLNIDNLSKQKIYNHSPHLITFGFNKNSTITLSSANLECSDRILFCIQKNFKSISGNVILEQEFPIYYNKENISLILVSTTVGLLNDFKINELEKIF